MNTNQTPSATVDEKINDFVEMVSNKTNMCNCSDCDEVRKEIRQELVSFIRSQQPTGTVDLDASWYKYRKMSWELEYAENGVINRDDFGKALSEALQGMFTREEVIDFAHFINSHDELTSTEALDQFIAQRNKEKL